MQADELVQLVASLRQMGTDDAGVEAKAAAGGLPKSVRETLSAFANTSGGVILLGVSETDDFAVTGVADAARMAADMASICATEMEPPLRPLISQIEIDGAAVVVIEVPEVDSTQKPCYVKARGLTKGSFVRVHDGDQTLSAYEVQMLMANRGQPTDDIEPVVDSEVTDLDPDLVGAYLSRVRKSRPYAYSGLDDAAALKQSRVLVESPSGEQRCSIAGILALGKYPQSRLPQLNVTFVVYPTERGPDTVGGVRFLDNVTLEGPVPVIARDALAALRRNMRRRSTVSGIGRTDTWEYPEAALREAIVNAIVHRDLSPHARGTQVQIEMYPDRLVIRNPGGLFGPVAVADLGEAGTSSARNATLLKILEDVTLPDEDRAVCENRGSGIRTMVEALRVAGMSPPRFEDRISSFTVTFPNHTLLDEDTVAWIQRLNEPGLSDNQCVALAMLRSGEQLDNPTYRAATGVDSRVATADLQDLVTRELVVQIGARRWTEYRLAPRAAGVDGESRRLSPRDRRPIILDALKAGHLSRAEIEAQTGLGRKVVIRWLGILKKERLVQTVGDVSPQSPNVRYERTSHSWGQDTLDLDGLE